MIRYEACQGSALFVLLLLQHHADRQMKRFGAAPPPVVASLLPKGFVCDGRILVRHTGFWLRQISATSAMHVVQMSGSDHADVIMGRQSW